MFMGQRLRPSANLGVMPIRIAPPAKHVLVLGDKSDVDTYIRQQSAQRCQDIDGSTILISSDHLQFHPCAMKDVQKNYLDCVGAKLPFFDAIVLTSGSGLSTLQTERTISDLAALRQKYPDSIIMVDGFLPKNYIPAGSSNFGDIAARSFAIPATEGAVIHDTRKAITVARGNPDYQLAAPIDRMCVNSRNKANDLRDALSMPPIPATGRGA